MDFSYFQNIMKPNDFARLNKLDKYNLDSLYSFVNKYPKIIDLMLEYFKENPKKMNEYEGPFESPLLTYELTSNLLYNPTIMKNICELDIIVNNNAKTRDIALLYAIFYNCTNTTKVLLEYDTVGDIITNREKFNTMIENIRFLNVKN